MKKLITIVAFFILAANSLAFADNQKPSTTPNLPLYEQPDTKSKIIDNLKIGQAIIPIFQKGDWIKIADPQNGNVGWVDNKELGKAGFPQIFIKTYSQTGAGKNNSGYQFIQYSGSSPVDEKQLQNLVKNFQAQQAELQNTFDKILNQSMSSFNAVMKQFQDSFPSLYSNTMPMVQPIIILQRPATPTQTNNQTPTTTTKK